LTDLPSNSIEILNKGTIIKEGDTNFIFLVKLLDAYNNPVDLTNVSSITIYFSNSSNLLLLEKQATQALSEGDGVISFSFDEDDATGNGIINLQFNVTYNTGKIEKFPASDFTKIQITPSLDNLENVQLSTLTLQQVTDQLNTSFSTSLNSVKTELNSNINTSQSTLQTSINTVQTNLNNHQNNTNNPHQVTASQIGLGNVNNTADIDKPVSIAQQEAINAVDNKIGDLSQLPTTDKSSLVNSNKELAAQLANIAININNYGAKGDGVSDDTEELQNLFNSLVDNTWVLFTKTYRVSHVSLSGKHNIRFVGNGKIIQQPTTTQSYTMENPLSTEPMITEDNCEGIVFSKGLQLFPVHEALYITATSKRTTFDALIDGQSSSKFSGLFFAGDDLAFNGIIRNCGVLPVWNGTQNPYSTCNGLHVSIGANVTVKGEIYNNGMNGLFTFASRDITVDKSAHIYGNGMSGIQLAFADAPEIEQKRYKIAGTIHDNYADGVDINNASGSSEPIEIDCLIDGTIQYHNGFMGENVTQDGSGLATLKNVTGITTGINDVRDCARAGFYAVNVKKLKVVSLQVYKTLGVGEGAYFENCDEMEILSVDIYNTVGEGMKLYGSISNSRVYGGRINAPNAYSLTLPTSGLTLTNTKISKLDLIGNQPINGIIDLDACTVINNTGVGVSCLKNDLVFKDCDITGQTLGLQTNGYSGIKLVGGSVIGLTNTGLEVNSASFITDGTYIESQSGSSPALRLSAATDPKIMNISINNSQGGNSIRAESIVGAVYQDNVKIIAGIPDYGSQTVKTLQWA
jgi:hypothetical protein